MKYYAKCTLTYDNYPIELLVKLIDDKTLKIYDDVDDEWYAMDDEKLATNILSKSNDQNHVLAFSAILDILEYPLVYTEIIGSKGSPSIIDLDLYK